MATILPFAGFRPRADLADKVAAPPYDVVSTEEARLLAADNPHSFLHVNKPEIDFDPGTDTHDEKVYRRAGDNIRRFTAEGIFSQDDKPCLYLYRQSQGAHVQTGLVGLVPVDDYEHDRIRKHELTRPDKEDDRVRHMQAVEAQVGPVFLTYRSEKNIDELVTEAGRGKPCYDFTVDGVRHGLWVIEDDGIIGALIDAFTRVPVLYIADGHHRSAAACRYRALRREGNPGHRGDESYNFFMAALFPHDQLRILDYNRVIRDLAGMTPAGFLARLAGSFDVTALPGAGKPANDRCFSLYLAGRWYSLGLKSPESGSDPVAALNISRLQHTILGPLLGIEDPRTDARIDFIGGIRGLQALSSAVDGGEYAAAIACYPVAIEQLLAVADAGLLMPPKSTWFEPKLKSGLVYHALAGQ